MTWRLEQPWWLLLLLLAIAIWRWKPRRGGAAFGAYLLLAVSLPHSRGPGLWRLLIAGSLAFLTLAMARPQWGRSYEQREAEGRDLVLVIDLSLSMITDDMYNEAGEAIDRLEAVIDAAERFVEQRPNDRIGLVFFAQRAESYCPLTFDHDTVISFLRRVEAAQRLRWEEGLRRGRGAIQAAGLLGNGTNLGLGMGVALKGLGSEELRDDERSGRAMILITDGKDTASAQMSGWEDPIAAARHAESLEVKLYGIGVGDPDGKMTNFLGQVHAPRNARVPIDAQFLPDMGRLREIVETAGGIASHATDREELAAIFDRIDELEPTPHQVEEVHDYNDRYQWPLVAGLILLALALVAEPRLRGPL